MCCKKEKSEGEVCSVDHRETYPVIISVDQRAGIMICHHAHDSATKCDTVTHEENTKDAGTVTSDNLRAGGNTIRVG